MSAIIPAAGANTRLKDKVAPFLKPTLLVDGEPLIVHATNFAMKCRVTRAFTVVSPSNAGIIATLVKGATQRHAESLIPLHNDLVNYILQPEPLGIVDAIQRCIHFVQTDWTVILCADNLFRVDHHAEIKVLDNDSHDTPLFASRELQRAQARRFTTYASKLPHPFRSRHDIDSTEICWIGPLLLPTKLLAEASKSESSIEDVLNSIHLTRRIEPYPMLCSDMGIPEELGT